MLPWCLDLQWKEKLPDGEGARATRRANKISVISRSLSRSFVEQTTTIALQYMVMGAIPA